MKRLTATVKGKVQRVGYRGFVLEVARELGITGYVENLKPYDVRVVAEGEKTRLEEFLDRLHTDKFPIRVEDIHFEWSAATGEFEYFEIRRGEWQEELVERFDFAAALLYGMLEREDGYVTRGAEENK